MDILNKISIVMLTVVMAACSSTKKSTTSEESVAFSAVKSKASYELSCKPLNSIVAKDASWVQKCNSAAYDFLITQTKNGVVFEKEISQQPFGQAAFFMANMLKSNPKNFEAVSISQTYTFISNKT